jgi:uncharacterized protein (TIGR02145 family)
MNYKYAISTIIFVFFIFQYFLISQENFQKSGISRNTIITKNSDLTNIKNRVDRNIYLPGQIPVLTTTVVTNITETTATSGGNITSDGGAAITARGVCWSTGLTPSVSDTLTNDGPGAGNFVSNITGLTANTTYYLRAYAINSAGTSYGDVISFKTHEGTAVRVTDKNKNEYHSVKIGTQVWMIENLRTTKYRNGDDIPNVTKNTTWTDLTIGTYCDYNNNPDNASTYGRLYNWYAVNDKRKIAPEGWHVASDSEWTILTNFLGGVEGAGSKLKEAGLTHWNTPNQGSTNESGFTALPGGSRAYGGAFQSLGTIGFWWTSTQESWGQAWQRHISSDQSVVGRRFDNKENAFSVRCIKD